MKLILILTAFCYSSTLQHLMPGGQLSHHITPDNKKTAKEILRAVQPLSEILKWQNSPQLIYFSTQVVAGTNYYLVFKYLPANSGAETQYQCYVIWKRLPGNYPGLQMNDPHPARTSNSEACKDCHAVGPDCTASENDTSSENIMQRPRLQYLGSINAQTNAPNRSDIHGMRTTPEPELLNREVDSDDISIVHVQNQG